MSDPGPRRVADPVSIPFRPAPATGYPPKTVLCAQGDPATHVFLIEEGSAVLIRSSPDGREIILGFRGPGSVLGTTPVILGFRGGRPHSASIVTVSRTRIRTLPAGAFLDALRRDPGLSDQLHRLHALEIEEYDRRIAGLVFESARQRLEAFLRELSEMDRGSRAGIRLPVGQPDLAKYLATSRQHVNHLLRELEREGILSRSKGWYVVDPQKLRKLSTG